MDKATMQQACKLMHALRAHADRARKSECAALDTQIADLDAAVQLIGKLLDRIERLELDRDALERERVRLLDRYISALRAARDSTCQPVMDPLADVEAEEGGIVDGTDRD